MPGRYSGGNRVDVSLEYGRDLTVRIRDNGVGIDASVVEKGRPGHFGLPGIRERAEGIGGRFTVVSAPGSGTVITLVVPGPSAFRTGRRNSRRPPNENYRSRSTVSSVLRQRVMA